jgi:hypothetical protein
MWGTRTMGRERGEPWKQRPMTTTMDSYLSSPSKYRRLDDLQSLLDIST